MSSRILSSGACNPNSTRVHPCWRMWYIVLGEIASGRVSNVIPIILCLVVSFFLCSFSSASCNSSNGESSFKQCFNVLMLSCFNELAALNDSNTNQYWYLSGYAFQVPPFTMYSILSVG